MSQTARRVHSQVLSLAEYIERFVCADGPGGEERGRAELGRAEPGAGSDDAEAHGKGEAAAAAGCAERGYLAQHPLFAQIPTLRDDIRVPSFCSARGPGITVT